MDRLFSCISMLKPFGVGFVQDTNSTAWTTNIQALPGLITITWPLEAGYSTGGTLSFQGGITDYTFGAPDIESRVDGEFMVHPSGAPTVTAGTTP